MRKLILKSSIILGISIIFGVVFSTLNQEYNQRVEETQIFHRYNENTRITLDVAYEIASKLENVKNSSNSFRNLDLDDLLFALVVESVSEVNNDMFIYMTDELLVDFMNFQFKVFNDFSEEVLDIIRKDFSNDKEALRFFENYIVQEISELSYNDYASDSMLRSANSLRLLLSGAGLSSAAINVIVGSFNVVVAAVRAWFTPNVVRALLIGSALLVVTTTVILNWGRISPILDAVIAEFVNVARNFASTITNFFTSVRNQAITVFAITIGTLLFFADVEVTTANAASFQRHGRFHLALIRNNRVHFTPMDVGRTIAVQALRIILWENEIAEFGTYTFDINDARAIAMDASNDGTLRNANPERSRATGIVFLHFHPRTSSAHSWFGIPV